VRIWTPAMSRTFWDSKEGHRRIPARMVELEHFVIESNTDEDFLRKAAHRLRKVFDAYKQQAQTEHEKQQMARREEFVETQRQRNYALSELNAFKHLNNLKRKPVHPDSNFLHIAAFLFLGVVEGVANSFFFAEGSDFGLLGGLQLALVVAALNIMVSGFAGIWLRNLFHTSIVRRLMGFGVAVGYLCFLGTYHLAVGHYREALQGEQPEYAAQDAVTALLNTPFAINDLHSWMLKQQGYRLYIMIEYAKSLFYYNTRMKYRIGILW